MSARPRSRVDDTLMHRRRLVERLEALSETACLVLVSAPVGYGKSTVVRQWSRTTRRRPVWLPVTRGHRDPHSLARDLAAALLTLGPSDGILGSLVTDRGYLPVEAAAEQLAAAVRLSGRPVALVVEDLHEARTSASLDLVVQLAARLPEDCLVVATADRRPRLPVGDTLGATGYAELGAGELEFTDDEITELLD